MDKRELARQVAQQVYGLTYKECLIVLDTAFTLMTESLAKRESVNIRTLGYFSLKPRRGRIVRHPRSREEVIIPMRFDINFMPSKQLKDKVKKRKPTLKDFNE